MKNWRNFLISLLVINLIALSAISCNSTSPKTYMLKHGEINFSLEYPGNYKIISSDIQSNPEASLSVRFARASGFLGTSSTEPVLCVNISSPAVAQISPEQAADTAGSHNPAQEIDRTTITIAGIKGEFVAYSYPSNNSAFTITREVFFNINGVLWNVLIYSGTTKADEAKLVFNQVINSFKLLP